MMKTRLFTLCLSFAAFCVIALASNTPVLAAAEDAALQKQIKQFNELMSSNDIRDKRKAVSVAQAMKDEDTSYNYLVKAVADRQARNAAVKALRAKSGLTPPGKGGGRGYPGYPSADNAAQWGVWNAARQKVADEEKKVKALEEKAKEMEEKAKEEKEQKDNPEAATADGMDGENKDAEKKNGPQLSVSESQLGKLDRVIFRDGSFLVCYITVKRTDLNGALTSLHVVHPDGGGEEDIDASLIARIEEDIR